MDGCLHAEGQSTASSQKGFMMRTGEEQVSRCKMNKLDYQGQEHLEKTGTENFNL